MDKDTAKSSFGQLVAPLNRDDVQEIVDVHRGDKYVKKLSTWAFLMLILQAQLLQKRGLRSLEQMLLNEHLQAELGFESISSSQLSRTCHRLHPHIFRDIYLSLAAKVQKAMGNQEQRFGNMGPIKIVDSSTITLCLQKYGWAKYVRKKAGVKLHLRLVFVNEDFVYPEKAVITPAKPDDRKQMAALIDEEGAIYVFDRGYADYRKFDIFCDTNIGFTTRLRRKAIYEVIEELPVAEGSPILRDTVVTMGNPQKRMKNVLRRIETTDSQGNSIVILTNRFDVTAEEIGELYRNRWQIELFFKYIKQHLKMTQFYGTTEQAVQTQIYIGLIAYLLLTLMRLKCEGKKLQLLYIHRVLVELLWKPWSQMMEYIYRKPSRTSKGRQKKRE
jgi:Transposase DDE domain/Domain of unknown function (DUF4372)